MMSLKNIFIISSYEARVLWRNWFFRIVALAGIGFLTIFNLAVFGEMDTPSWHEISNSWILPYATMIIIAIPQVAAVVFLATGLVKKDKKLDTNEVFFARPISNADYVFGKALAILTLFFLLNVVLLFIALIVGLTSPVLTINAMAFLMAPLATSVPTIIFTTGIAFLLVTIIKNQPISIVLLIGLSGVLLIYYFDQFSNIFDFLAFRLSMLASEMSGPVDIEFALWQRAFYLLSGIGCLFITAFFLDRLPGQRLAHATTLAIGICIMIVSSLIIIKLWAMRQGPILQRQEMISVNGKWANVPNVDIISHAIDLEWIGDEIVSTSEMLVKNNSAETLDTIYFSLNPGLIVEHMKLNGEPVKVGRMCHMVFVNDGLSVVPGQELTVQLKYHGPILESAAHLEVDQKRYESANNYIAFTLKKKFAFLESDYVLLTKDVLWYPDTRVGFNRVSATKKSGPFVAFQLSVHVPAGKTPISQGKVVTGEGVYHFKPEYPLSQLSLVIGDYEKKEITVDGVAYSLFHHPKHDFFARHLDQLADTLSYLVTDIVNEYEDAQRLSYPFSRLQFVEVPLQFTAFDKIYESHQAYLQPETVFWPEEGGEIRQFDFRRQLRDMNRQATRENQVLTDKQKQANIFNDLVKKVYTKQIGSTWQWGGQDVDNPDYSIFPNYYDFNSGIESHDWPLINRSIATYLRNDKQERYDYSREINGISFAEECNNLMRISPMGKILTDEEFAKITKSVSLKSQYLFSYIGQLVGENNFKSFLYQWVNTHRHQLSSFETFRQAMISHFNVDIDPIIRKVYSETAQPAFEIIDLQKYEVMDGDRKRYQIRLTARNSGDSDGVIEIKFDTKQNNDDEDYYYAKVNEEVEEEAPGELAVIKRGQTKLLGFVLDEKPHTITINTIVSRNIPSIITMPLGEFSKPEGQMLFKGELVVEKHKAADQYEIIVDNEDPGFSSFSPIKPTILKAYLEAGKADQKYHGRWSSSYSRWLTTTGSSFYGKIIRSAQSTRSGAGEKIATWTPEFKEEGFYDIYVYMMGKNQNDFQGRDGDSKQFTYHFVVNNADGTDNIRYNVSNAEPGWNYLGSYYFTKTGGSVALTDECELRTVYADAVKWIKQ